MTTFNLEIFSSKQSIQAHINELIEKRSQMNGASKEKGLLTQQIILLSEMVELDFD